MPVPKPLPSIELLDHIFEVDSTSPSGLRWRNPRSKRLKAGSVAGTLNQKGYWVVTLKLEKVYKFLVHRIIYCLLHKEDPGCMSIDHSNNITFENTELRKVTHSQNHANRKPNSHYKGRQKSSQYKGVRWDKNKNKWMATIKINGKTRFIGYFCDEGVAAEAYNRAASTAWGEYAYLNKITNGDKIKEN
jgi:hypothetical protein